MFLKTFVPFVIIICWSNSIFSQSITLTATQDAFVRSTNSSSNFGGTSLVVGRQFKSPSYYTSRSFLKFDLSSIPSNAIITSSVLKVYQAGNGKTSDNNLGICRVQNSWTETGITWALQSSFGYDSPISFTTIPTTSTGFLESTLLTNQIQNIVAGNYANNGWMLRLLNTETLNQVNYRNLVSREGSVAYRPKLIITYYIPMTVTDATINHESSVGSNDGSISPVLAGGPGGTLTYKWFNSSGVQISSSTSSPNLSNIAYGWYGLQVTSSVAGSIPFYYAFLVGRKCSQVQVLFNPDNNYMDDNLIFYKANNPVVPFEELISETYQYSNVYSTTPTIIYPDYFPLIKFNIWIPNNIVLEAADLTVECFNNSPISTGNNSVLFAKINNPWNEKTVSFNSYINGIGINPYSNLTTSLTAPTLHTNSVVNINALVPFQEYQANNTTNNGWIIRFQNPTNNNLSYNFYSSDEVNIAKRPRVNFIFSLSNPTAPDYCNQVFAKLDRKMTGVKYKTYMTHFYFFYDEEYSPSTTSLKYKVFKADNQTSPVMSSSSNPLNSLQYGDNRYALNVGALPNGVYTLEVMNDKEEKFYLRFEKTN